MAKKLEQYLGVGRRKRAIASVILRKGSGKYEINGRSIENYFPTQFQKETVLAPLAKFELSDKYDLFVRLKGGGIEAQSVALRLGISRALVKSNEDLKAQLKELGYLTRDPRKKERKKYGLAGARKRFQYSKR